MTPLLKAGLTLVLCLAVTGCSLAPDYKRPEQDIPKEWRSVDLGPSPLNTDWWTRFNDPVLNALVEEALKNNQDLAESLAKIDSAAAKLGVGTSQLAPSVSGAGAATSQSNSTKIANYNSIADRSYVNYQGQLSASWELDFWGKYRNNYTMLSDVLLNTVVSHEALRLSVASQTAQSYFALLALDMQLATAKRTLRTREDAFGIYTSRYRQGDITELDWQRARAEVETARAQVHSSTVAVDSAEASLAVLPAGLPSELLERRPDVRAAEYMIMAYNANIGVARAEFFPSISLTGMLGTLSASVVNLFSGPAGAWSYGVTGSMPLLDFGRTWYNVKDAEAQKEAAIAVYRKTVQNAFKDVRTSLTSQREADAIVAASQAQVDSLRRAAEIARLQYDNGYTDYLTVLDAERQLFSAELSLANALRDRLNAVVSVCMALGGGWQDPNVKPSFPVADAEELVKAHDAAGQKASQPAAAPAKEQPAAKQ